MYNRTILNLRQLVGQSIKHERYEPVKGKGTTIRVRGIVRRYRIRLPHIHVCQSTQVTDDIKQIALDSVDV
ncbi:hypothetical protein KFU94_28550 [Chloroflexi bacterium TSY]|nr:hypothetical protein [Chloroflexi bacterium TSY]